MSGFRRALRGEVYQLLHRNVVRWSLLAVVLFAVLWALIARAMLGALHGAGGPGPGHGAWNFWPQFASTVRGGSYLVELLSLLVLAGWLPRETASGAVRDPLVRGIARRALLSAKAVTALVLPLALYLAVILASWTTCALLFDAGDVLDDQEDLVVLSVQDDRVDDYLYLALLHGAPPLLALGMVALGVSALFRSGVAAAGVVLGIVLLTNGLHGFLGDRAPWIFADTLPALGSDSYLARVAEYARGYADAYPRTFDAVVRIGWIAPWPALLIGYLAGILVFRRRAL